MQGSYRARSLISSLKDFFKDNKKVLVCACVVFLIGIVIGVIAVVRSVDGEFERIPRSEADFGGTKVFFIACLALLGAYVILLASGINTKTVFLVILPFLALGFVSGQYGCALIARYGGIGLVNLFVAYIPFFLCSFICFSLCAVSVLAPDCGCSNGTELKNSFVQTLKLFAINVAISFVIFVIIGSIFGVIIIEVY